MKNKVRILSTTSLEPSLINKAKEQNIIIDVVSFVEIEIIRNENLSEAIKDLFGKQLNVVFTSANAVDAVRALVTDVKPRWTMFCIEGNTRKAVSKYFGESEIKGTGKDAGTLAEAIVNEKSIKEIVFFCGNIRRDELPEKLTEAGITVKEIVVYDTTEKPKTITEQYDAILFFSPSGVNSFFSVNKIEPDAVLFAIGDTTGNAIKEQTKNKIVVSEKPSKKYVLTKAIQYFQKQLITN